jgi:hypothetical protein
VITSRDVKYPARRVSKLAWLFTWVIVPLAAAGLIFVGARGIGPAVAAQMGHGTHGYFVPERLNCQNRCPWQGNFVLPSGKIVRRGVSLDNPHGPLSLGVRVPALDTGEQGVVFPPNGGRLWILTLIELLSGIVISGLWIWRVHVRTLRRRRAGGRVPDFLIPQV